MCVPESDDRVRPSSPTRILLAVHGGEPAGWGREASRLVARWAEPEVRVLGLVAVPCPPFTSLIPAAARRYRGARTAWEDAERKRVEQVIDEMMPALPAGAEIAWVRAADGARDRVIAEHARAWAADVLVLAAAPAAHRWLGTVHEGVLRRARCPVLVAPVPAAQGA
jgi:nucleotide-binding universal stress UspA family protein